MLFYSDGVTETEMRIIILIVGICIAIAIYLVVKSLGKRVAEAAKEGSFLGFGGERVSEGERQMLAKLDRALAPSGRA